MGDELKVILAGYTVDAEVIEKAKRGGSVNPDEFSPECVPAAYARISRDPREIPELRADSRTDVEAARKSNANIIFDMGHKAVGNIATFQFDIIGLSRLAVEELEERRIASGYIEKSQRYIKMKGDFIVPKEYSPIDAVKFRHLVEEVQNRFYLDNVDKLIELQFSKNPDLAAKAREAMSKGVSDKMNRVKNTLEGWGKEDTRYSLGLSTQAQIGTAFSATSLEHAIRNMKYSELAEARDLAQKLFDVTKDIAPSLILYTDPEIFQKSFKGKELHDENFRETPRHMKKVVEETFERLKWVPQLSVYTTKSKGDTTMVRCNDPDTNVMAALLFTNSKMPIEFCYRVAAYMKSNGEEALNFMKAIHQYVTEFDNPPREFESSSQFTYEVKLSSSAFAQLKRHRMMTLLSQDYDTDLGIVVPESVKEAGLEQQLRDTCGRSAELYREFLPRYGKAAEYCLTNAHMRRVLVSINPREINHLSRQRCDSHAQWDIRQHAHDMLYLGKEIAPLALLLACGKDEFAELHKKIYGE